MSTSRVREACNLFLQVYRTMKQRNIGLISAGVAFFAILSIFPGIAALISVTGLLADPLIIRSQLDLLGDILPQNVTILLQAQVTRLIGANEGALGWATMFSTLVALFLARRGVNAILLGMNVIHGGDKRSGLKNAVAVFAITLGTLLAGIVAALSVLVLPIVLSVFPLVGQTGWVVETARWMLTLGMIAAWLWVFYRFGPNRDSNRNITIRPGLILALVLWIIMSAGFSYVLSNFGNYDAVYGSVGAVIALLTWLYFSAYVIMLGGVVNATIEEQKKSADKENPPAAVSPMSDKSGLPEKE